MAQSSIDTVRETEVKAEETLRAAAQQAAGIVDDAHTEAVKLAHQAEDAAKKKAADAVAAAHQASQQQLEKAAQELSGEMQALRDKALANQPKAVQMILDALA